MSTKYNPFRAAKRFLNGGPTGHGSTGFICIALADAGEYDNREKLAEKAVRHVMRMLAEHATVNQYLEALGIEHTYAEIQRFRHRWLDHMADQWDQGLIK